MKSIALACGFALTAYALVASSQQNIPSMPGGKKPGGPYAPKIGAPGAGPAIPDSNVQGVPGVVKQFVPGGGQGGSVSSPSAHVVDRCSLDVSEQELRSLRALIVGSLKGDKAAMDDFETNERKIAGTCTRQRAVYYIKALARIKE